MQSLNGEFGTIVTVAGVPYRPCLPDLALDTAESTAYSQRGRNEKLVISQRTIEMRTESGVSRQLGTQQHRNHRLVISMHLRITGTSRSTELGKTLKSSLI